MMIQATVPTAFAVFATPGLLDRGLVVAGVVTLGSVCVLFLAFWRGWITRAWLALMALFYLSFAALTIVFRL
jgi:cation:H+ antiporter